MRTETIKFTAFGLQLAEQGEDGTVQVPNESIYRVRSYESLNKL